VNNSHPAQTFDVDRGTRLCYYVNEADVGYSPVPPYPLITIRNTFGYRQAPGQLTPQWFDEIEIIGCRDTSGPSPVPGKPLPLDDPACVLRDSGGGA